MKTFSIEVSPRKEWGDARGAKVRRGIADLLNIEPAAVSSRDVYTVQANVSDSEIAAIAGAIANPVLQDVRFGDRPAVAEGVECDWIIAVGFKPGVTDNVARTTREAVGDVLGRKLAEEEKTYSSVEYLVSAPAMTREDALKVGYELLANKLIQTVQVYGGEELAKPLPFNTPSVEGGAGGNVRTYDLEVSDEGLMEISRKGILALSLEEMQAIRNYFRNAQGREAYGLGAKPTDVELEVLAQTWSEHCKHKIFDAVIDYKDAETGAEERIDSCYKTFIKQSTKRIGEKVDYLVSVFHDNAGVIRFNDKLDLVYKVETHNSPSALDPYGGAMTGIVGVNRDPLGTGQGADLLLNVWGYCLGSPFTDPENVPEGLLHPRRLRDGVHQGVIDGGNQSGIPYAYGWEYFDDRYIGKPLVYCGTVGTLPREINGVPGSSKEIKPGDLVVMGGGRIGKDGIHGATFSSEELHKESPTAAVQIGDPITQKKLSDFMYEARKRGLYRFVTDNGAGGLSSSVGEMAEICGGCRLDLDKAPLKYAGLDPWEVLVSEAQERMSFAVPPANLEAMLQLAKERDVELTVIGEFTDNGKFVVDWAGKTVAALDIEFMHKGLPRYQLNAVWKAPVFDEPEISCRNCADDLIALAGRLNCASDEFKARQYDHEVKGLSVVKPMQGVCRDVFGDATVSLVEPLGTEGVVLSAAILPRYSDVDTYWMMASAIDLAVRRIIAVGGDMKMIAGLDNFCWPDPVQSAKTPDGEYKLAQLVRANKALAEFTERYLVPCISGKDSMKNDSTRGGRKISIPPSVLFSTISKMDDVAKAVTLDFKNAGDLVYVIGETKPELGGSEYFAMLDATGNNVPKVNADVALATYDRVSRITAQKLACSLVTPALGGLGMAVARSAMAGRKGITADLTACPGAAGCKDAELLFSESNSRFVMTCKPADRQKVEAILEGIPYACIGQVTDSQQLELGLKDCSCNIAVDELLASYKGTLAGI